MRLLVLEHGLLSRDCAEALRAAGHTVDCHPPGRGPVMDALARAEGILSINLNPSLARVAARRRIPYAAWVVDPRVNRMTLAEEAAEASEHTAVFCYERAQLPLYREMGYPHVAYLPTGAAPRFCAPEAPREDLPVGFVGSPLVEASNEFVPFRRAMEAQAATGGEGAASARAVLEVVAACVREQEGDLEGFRIPAVLKAQERARGIRLVSEEWGPLKWQFAYGMAKEAARAHRVAVCRALAPLGLSVWGPPEWRDVLVEGMRYEGEASYPDGARAAYLRCALHVNVTRIYAGDVVPNRVWDVLACGGFLMSDARGEIRRLLPELPIFSTPAEAVDLARRYLERPDERRALARRLGEAVRARHTLAHRLQEIMAWMVSRRLPGSDPAPP